MRLAVFLSCLWACSSTGPAFEFENLRVEEIAARRAVVRFDTSVPATCEVIFGVASENLDNVALDPDMEPGELALEHNIPIEDLQPETTYYFRARATDADGNTEETELDEFSTIAGDDPTEGLENVALLAAGTTVQALSSNWGGGGNDSSYGIHKALDGMMSTEWSTAGDGDDAFVELDLGQERTITHLAYRSRMMVDGTSIVEKIRLIDLDSDKETSILATPDHTLRYVFALPEPWTTRHVRLEAVTTTGGNTGGKEIELYE
jgi:hypothetical protein